VTGHDDPGVGAETRVVRIESGAVALDGEIGVPAGAAGVVLFAHGSGSGRHSPRNRAVARAMRGAGLGTLLFDLLTRDEEALDSFARHRRFDVELLAGRLAAAVAWLATEPEARDLRPGFFGSSTGGAAALVAAAEIGPQIGAVVSRGGRPDLAGRALEHVASPTLLIVGGLDDLVLSANERAYDRLWCEKDLTVIPGATHLFEEPGALDEVGRLAAAWFRAHLRPARRTV
jgi:putative phosphoribosyl transferase